MHTVLHTCARFLPVGARALCQGDAVSGESSWIRAAEKALRAFPNVRVFSPGGSEVRLTRKAMRRLIQHKRPKLFCSLLCRPCTCKTKTKLLCSKQISLADAYALDRTPWGAKILTTKRPSSDSHSFRGHSGSFRVAMPERVVNAALPPWSSGRPLRSVKLKPSKGPPILLPQSLPCHKKR